MKCFMKETHQSRFRSRLLPPTIDLFFILFFYQFFKVIYNTVFSLKSLTSLGCVLLAEGLTAKTWDSCGRWSVQHSARKPSAAYAESGRRFLECKQPPCLIFTENGPKRCLLEGLRLYLDSKIQTVLLCMISAPFSTTSSVSVISLFFLPLLLSSLSHSFPPENMKKMCWSCICPCWLTQKPNLGLPSLLSIKASHEYGVFCPWWRRTPNES